MRAAPAASAPRPRVLLLDEEPNVLLALRRLLRREPYDVVAAAPADAEACFAGGAFAVVVADPRAPAADGGDLLTYVRVRAPGAVRIVLTAYADARTAIDAINDGAVFRFLQKPWDDDGLRRAVRQGVEQYRLVEENRRLQTLTQAQNDALRDLNDNLRRKVMERTFEVVRLNQSLEQSFMGAVQALGDVAGAQVRGAGAHGRRVAALARSLARRLGLEGRAALQVEVAGALHDVGKIRFDAALVNAPPDDVSRADQIALRTHVIHGENIVRCVPNLEDAARFVRHHHERYDGEGYPNRLSGEAIPLGARIVAVADAFDRALHPHDPNAHVTPSAALRIVQREAGLAFDPRVVAALRVAVEEDEAGVRQMWEVQIHPLDLRAGMILTRDVVTRSGRRVLAGEHLLERENLPLLREVFAADPPANGLFVYRHSRPEPLEIA